ncbi:MAG: hypothetical protein IJ587_03140 [Synergistaceae bacterium]|nr:hypothetical protein [Synergistaceae bacterium]
MATSSIFKTFTVEGPIEVENFVKMLDSEPMPIPRMKGHLITDPEEGWRILRESAEYMKKRAEARKAETERK